jgi:hypothetical protein
MPGFMLLYAGHPRIFCDPTKVGGRNIWREHGASRLLHDVFDTNWPRTHAQRRADIHRRRGYINPPGTSGLLAFELELKK